MRYYGTVSYLIVILFCGCWSASCGLRAAETSPSAEPLIMKVELSPALKTANKLFMEATLDVSLVNQSPAGMRLDKSSLQVHVLFSAPAPTVPDQFGPPMSYGMNPSADPKDNVVFLQSGEMIGKRFPVMLAVGAVAHITVLFDAKQGIVKIAGNRNTGPGIIRCTITGHIEDKRFILEKQEYAAGQER